MGIVLLLYGCLLLSGAYFGLKAGSKVSMVMGIISGLIVLFGTYLVSIDPVKGYYLISSVSSFLSVIFLIRLIKTHKFMPAGMLLGASALILILSLYQLSII
jgi:uncharacterized membrane protein (UPF0136 family)